jgi:hypothetical protein
MKILLDSGVTRYIFTLFFINILFAFLTALLGIIFFVFFLISFCTLFGVGYFFRTEERIINENSIVSPTDGLIKEIVFLEKLPDIITNNEQYQKYHSILMVSNLNNLYFKYTPCDGKIEDIQIFLPRHIPKNSNFVHKNYRTYLSIHIIKDFNKKSSNKNKEKQESVFLIFELLCADEYHNLYNLYINKGDIVTKGQMLLCAHFYSLTYLLVPGNYDLKIHQNQSLFSRETAIT